MAIRGANPNAPSLSLMTTAKRRLDGCVRFFFLLLRRAVNDPPVTHIDRAARTAVGKSQGFSPRVR